MKLQFLGGADEIGRSAVLVDDALLLDYGMATGTPPSVPIGSVEPDAVVLSHGHLDHVGAVPALLSGDARPPIHATPPTYELLLTLARDTLKLHGGTFSCPFTETELRRLTEVVETHGYGEPFEAAGNEVTFYNAGHIPGSAHVLVESADTRLLYTGDFHTGEPPENGKQPGRTDQLGAPILGQRLVDETTDRPEADVVITESTYADVNHPPRDEVERSFVETARSTIWEGGTVVAPAFAIGRTQELLLVCEAHDLDCYVDGMGKGVTRMLRQYPDFVRDPDALRRATSHARFVTGRDGQRKRIAGQNSVIVTTSGMLSGGPAMTYVPAVRSHPVNTIALTGYQVEGTPGRELLDTGRCELAGHVVPVSAQVELFDFSAHADRNGLRDFLSAYEGSQILTVHGDDTARFAERLRADGYLASAPELGETITV